jgi:hypothetical protein
MALPTKAARQLKMHHNLYLLRYTHSNLRFKRSDFFISHPYNLRMAYLYPMKKVFFSLICLLCVQVAFGTKRFISF